jgi:hypothetical protein
MTALHTQIDGLEAALQQLRTGDFQVFNPLPFMLDELRPGALAPKRHQHELLLLYKHGQETVSILKLDQPLESIDALSTLSRLEASSET